MSYILVYVPLSPVEPRIFPETLQSLFAMKWRGHLDVVFGWNETPGSWHKYDDLCEKHNRARRLALLGGYDGILFVENDMIIPTNTLEVLDEVNTDVVYGLYVGRHKPHVWLSFFVMEGTVGGSCSSNLELMQSVWGDPVLTKGAGLGCTLVRRNVLEAIEFRTHPTHEVADDWMFSLDCEAKGFTQAHHFGIVCGHITQESTVLWPDPFSIYREEKYEDVHRGSQYR